MVLNARHLLRTLPNSFSRGHTTGTDDIRPHTLGKPTTKW